MNSVPYLMKLGPMDETCLRQRLGFTVQIDFSKITPQGNCATYLFSLSNLGLGIMDAIRGFTFRVDSGYSLTDLQSNPSPDYGGIDITVQSTGQRYTLKSVGRSGKYQGIVQGTLPLICNRGDTITICKRPEKDGLTIKGTATFIFYNFIPAGSTEITYPPASIPYTPPVPHEPYSSYQVNGLPENYVSVSINGDAPTTYTTVNGD